MKETQSLIFSLLMGINFQLACSNNSAFTPFELEKDSFIKVGTGSQSRHPGNKDFSLCSLNDPSGSLPPPHSHTGINPHATSVREAQRSGKKCRK